MSNPDERPIKPSPVVRKRSPLERLFVWGGILLLLAVVLVEWRARAGYDATFSELQLKLRDGKRVPIADLPGHIRGFAYQGEETNGRRRWVTLKWPSLFKRHMLRLGVADQNQVYFVEPYDNDEPVGKAPANAVTRQNLPRGLPAGYENVVALTATEISPVQEMGGILLRELIRQGLLIAAQDELGLGTIDPSLGESIPAEDSPRSFPFTVKIATQSSEKPDTALAPAKKYLVKIELSRPTLDGKPFNSTDLELTIPAENRIESLAEQVAALSRGPFVEVWTKAGYKKSTRHNAVRKADAPEDRLDIVSQFALLRETHSQLSALGESPELIGRLVRAYANLGNLTDYHWSSASKVFKARALIYAERLILSSGKSPFSQAHRAYALAMTGRHGSALTAIQAAISVKGQPVPDWGPVIAAYCEFKPQSLEQIEGPSKELAYYLQVRLIDTQGDAGREDDLKKIERFLRMNGACFRAAEVLGDMHTLGPQQMLSHTYEEMWPEVYSRLAKIQDFPGPALKIAQAASDGRTRQPRVEFAMREKLIGELKIAATDDRRDNYPSWAVLEAMFRDESFVQVSHITQAQALWLGVPVDHTLVELKPLYGGHRFARYVDAHTLRGRPFADAVSEFLKDIDLSQCDTPMFPVMQSGMSGQAVIENKELNKAIMIHRDDIYEDVVRLFMIGTGSAQAMAISPHCPRFIAASLNTADFDGHAQELEERYSNSAVILSAIADKHRVREHWDDAIRCLKKSIAISPSHSTYEKLAGIYKSQENFDNWQDALERAIELPSFGLETAKLQVEIAESLMQRGEWKKAEPFAREAGASGAGWAMKTEARCAEGLGHWKEAEAIVKGMSHRYTDALPEWYFWCARTGRGNLAEAAALAEPYWISMTPPLDPTQVRYLATKQILEGDLDAAKATVADVYKDVDGPAGSPAHMQASMRRNDVLAGFFAAILAELSGDDKLRDSLLKKIEQELETYEVNGDLLNLIYGVLSGEERGRWNPQEFERVIVNANNGDITYYCYFAGLLLAKHGQQELADEYMHLAATAFETKRMGCVLANHALRKAQKPIGPMRLSNAPDSIEPIDRLLTKAKHEVSSKSRPDLAKPLFDKAVELRQDFVPSRIERARFSESQGNYVDAIADYEEAIRLDPRCFAAHAGLAWLLATCEVDRIRDGQKALTHAQLAKELKFYKSGRAMQVLAAAHAELGHFKEALDLEIQSLSSRDFGLDPELHDQFYKADKPYRQKLRSKGVKQNQ